MQGGGRYREGQGQDSLIDVLLQRRQRLFALVANIFQQLETHVQVGLLAHRGQYAGCQLGDRLLRRQAGHRVEQATDCCRTFLFGTVLAKRKQLAKDLQRGVQGVWIYFDGRIISEKRFIFRGVFPLFVY